MEIEFCIEVVAVAEVMNSWRKDRIHGPWKERLMKEVKEKRCDQ